MVLIDLFGMFKQAGMAVAFEKQVLIVDPQQIWAILWWVATHC